MSMESLLFHILKKFLEGKPGINTDNHQKLMVLGKPIDKTLFPMGTPDPSLAQVPDGLAVVDELQTSFLLLLHGDATDWMSILLPHRVQLSSTFT